MIIVQIQTNIHPDKMTEFSQAIDYILFGRKSGDKRCRSCYRKWDDENTFFYQEEWESMNELKSYMKGDHFKSLFGAMKVLGEVTMAQIITTERIEKLENFATSE